MRGKLRPYWCTRGTLFCIVDARNVKHARIVAGLRMAGYSPRAAQAAGNHALTRDDLDPDGHSLARKVRARRASEEDQRRWADILRERDAGVEGARRSLDPEPSGVQLSLC